MAGEWISVDCCLAQKPECLQIMAATGTPPDVVVGRLTIFWAWCQLNAVDGVVAGSADVLAIVAGGDADFWRAVEEAGWITFTADRKIVISGWEERFSQAAKERLKNIRRQQGKRKRDSTVTPVTPDRDKTVTSVTPDRDSTVTPVTPDRDRTVTRPGLEEKRGELLERLPPPSSPTSASDSSPMLMMSAKPIAPDADAATEWWFDDSPHDSWRRFYGAWEASGLPGLKKRPIGPPEAFVVRCHTPGWIAEAVDGIPRIRGKPYFATPPSIWQVLKDPDFFTKLANGAYDAAPAAKKTRAEIERDERKAIVQAVSLRLQEGERA